jgi:hypothetical protein
LLLRLQPPVSEPSPGLSIQLDVCHPERRMERRMISIASISVSMESKALVFRLLGGCDPA